MLGKWIYITKNEWDDSNRVVCSRCGYLIEHMDKRLDFCPDCNADMRPDDVIKHSKQLTEFYSKGVRG